MVNFVPYLVLNVLWEIYCSYKFTADLSLILVEYEDLMSSLWKIHCKQKIILFIFVAIRRIIILDQKLQESKARISFTCL